MRNKKQFQLNLNKENKSPTNSGDSVDKKSVSCPKTSRYGSLHGFQKQIANTPRNSREKILGNHKIKILIRNGSFIFEKKYMIYDIQCQLIRKRERQPSTISNNEALQKNQQSLVINFDATSFSITKDFVRQSFPIEHDNASYAEVKIFGYTLLCATIHNKKVQFVQLNESEIIDEQDVTIIQPIKHVEEGEWLRANKIQKYILRKQDKNRKKSFSFCWNAVSNTNHYNEEVKNSVKKCQPQWALLFGLYNTAGQRQKPTPKPILTDRENRLNDSNETITNSGGQKSKLIELLKKKEMKKLSKAISKKSLNQSGLSLGGITKKPKKENRKQEKQEKQEKTENWDAYGLEKIQIKKLINKNQIRQSQHLYNHNNGKNNI